MIKIKQKYLSIPLLLLFLLTSLVCFAQAEIPPVPTSQTSVYDGANLLNGVEKSSLERKLINYSDTTSTQIVVATVNTINGENIALYATEWAHKWGIGQEDEDNGIFILVAKNDRKLTIRTGYGIEHKLTDALSKRIIEQVITPQFKQGDYYSGLDKGTTVIMQIMSGEYQGTRQSDGSPIPFIFIILFFIILVIILANIRKRGGGNRGGRRRGISRSILDAIILSNQGKGGFGGGFGGSSSSGGGFSGGGFGGGFGGGGFGGGGASGGW